MICLVLGYKCLTLFINLYCSCTILETKLETVNKLPGLLKIFFVKIIIREVMCSLQLHADW